MDSPKENFFKDLENIGGLKMTNGTNYGCKLIIVLGMEGHSQAQYYCVIKKKKKRSLRL